MGDLIAEVVPLALAVALSPFPVIPAILLLFTPKPRAAGFSFLAGWIGGILVSTTAFLLLAAIIELADEPPTWASWTRIALGWLLIAVGLRQVLSRSEADSTPKWMSSIDGLEPAGAAKLGVVLSAANPKVLLLSAAAGLTIGSEQIGLSADVVAVLAFTVIASVTVALPVVLYSVVGTRILQPLGTIRSWLERHNATVMAVVILAIGTLLIVKGVRGL